MNLSNFQMIYISEYFRVRIVESAEFLIQDGPFDFHFCESDPIKLAEMLWVFENSHYYPIQSLDGDDYATLMQLVDSGEIVLQSSGGFENTITLRDYMLHFSKG